MCVWPVQVRTTKSQSMARNRMLIAFDRIVVVVQVFRAGLNSELDLLAPTGLYA